VDACAQRPLLWGVPVCSAQQCVLRLWAKRPQPACSACYVPRAGQWPSLVSSLHSQPPDVARCDRLHQPPTNHPPSHFLPAATCRLCRDVGVSWAPTNGSVTTAELHKAIKELQQQLGP
jgi:hypothetical protein